LCDAALVLFFLGSIAGNLAKKCQTRIDRTTYEASAILLHSEFEKRDVWKLKSKVLEGKGVKDKATVNMGRLTQSIRAVLLVHEGSK
jgi:hypothetical protein